MREINVEIVTKAVKNMCISSNVNLGEDVVGCIKKNYDKEESETGKDILEMIMQNIEISKKDNMPLCQDTGMAVIFMEVGQDVHFTGGNITDAINEGVRQGYEQGYLRKSVVSDPLIRENTGDNTPAVIYTDIVPGDKVKIVLAPKGFGSENMSRTKMLKPSDGVQGVIDFVVETVSLAGPNPCPPVVVGVGVGGTIDKAAQIAKKALTRKVGVHSGKEHVRKMEEEMLERINDLGIGPQGLGGSTTALAVNMEVYPTHIAGLPVAVNINCHVARHEEVVI